VVELRREGILLHHQKKYYGGVIMTVLQNPGRLDMVFTLSDNSIRRGSIGNVILTALDQDLYDITVAIANLLNDVLFDIRLATSKTYAA
jgi:hypothetical protein